MTAKNDTPGGGMSEARVSGDWQVGDVILDRYEVVAELGEGGMGKVLKVHDRYWNMDLAVKAPRASLFQTATQKENFLRECHSWMDLGLHNHIVTCHYVRVLGGIPRVFADFVDGGSLKDWIDEGTLYEEGRAKALERILDIAIQFAMGLQHAHEKGLIHQDVKPANVMMTAAGVARLTDFGLANARAAIGETPAADRRMSVLASYGGMTPAYCSPEQADLAALGMADVPVDPLQKLTRRSDLYSWAVSILEMFTGTVIWQSGNVAGQALESYLQQGSSEDDALEIPAPVRDLLRQCLRQDPAARPHDMNAAVDRLREIYGNLVGRPYPREMPLPAREMADVLNNKALSYMELGAKEYGNRAEALWREALTLDAHHPEATYNLSVREWRAVRIPVDEVVLRMEEVATSRTDDWRVKYLLGLVYLESGELKEAVALLEEVKASVNTFDVQLALTQVQGLVRRNISPVLDEYPEDRKVVFQGYEHGWLRWTKELVIPRSCLRVFVGHDLEDILSVCLSRNRRLALSGSVDKTLSLWDIAAGQCVHTFEGHTNRVNSVCLSVDGHWAVSGSDDKTLRLWDVSKSECLRVFEGHTGGVKSVCLSKDGRWAVSGSRDASLRLWKAVTGECVRIFEGHKWGVNSVCLSEDGHRLLSGGDDRTVRLWDVFTGDCLREFVGHISDVWSVCLSLDGRWAISGDEDGELRIWEVKTARCMRVLQHTGAVNSVCISSDGLWALSGEEDGVMQLWDISFADCTHLTVPSYALSKIISTEAVIGEEQRFRTAVDNTKKALAEGRYQEALIYAGKVRGVLGYERSYEAMSLWHQVGQHARRAEFRGGWILRTFKGHEGAVKSVCMSTDGYHALSGSSEDDTLRLWDVITGKCVRVFEGHQLDVNSVCLSADKNWALSGSDDMTLRLWDIATGECIQIFEGHEGGVKSVCLSASNRWALSGSSDKTLRLWDLVTGRCVRIFRGSEMWVDSVCLSADDCWALSIDSAFVKYSIRLWEMSTGRCVRTYNEHVLAKHSVCLSSDNRWAFSGGNSDIRMLDIATGQCMHIFKDGYMTGTDSISLSANGRWVLSGGGYRDRNLRLWDAAIGECVCVFQGHMDSINSVCFSANGRWALSGSDDKTLRLWELDWDYEALDPADWDEGARPYLENFLTLHTPYIAALPDGKPSEAEIICALTRKGAPIYTVADFNHLLETLANAGYGWLRPKGVRSELDKMAESWTGPKSLFESD